MLYRQIPKGIERIDPVQAVAMEMSGVASLDDWNFGIPMQDRQRWLELAGIAVATHNAFLAERAASPDVLDAAANAIWRLSYEDFYGDPPPANETMWGGNESQIQEDRNSAAAALAAGLAVMAGNDDGE